MNSKCKIKKDKENEGIITIALQKGQKHQFLKIKYTIINQK